MSACNLFFQLECARVVKGQGESAFTVEDVDRIVALRKQMDLSPMPKRKHRKSHGKIGLGELARMVAKSGKCSTVKPRLS